MSMITYADELDPGDFLVDYKLFVTGVSSNSIGDVVLRCATEEYGYPASTLLLQPNELVLVDD